MNPMISAAVALMMPWLKARAAEPSTWIGLMVAISSGLNIALPEHGADTLVQAGMILLGLVHAACADKAR